MPQGNDEELERFYQVGELYNMRKYPKKDDEDQFVRWINLKDSGLKNSHFNKISAPIPSVTLFNRTKGVRPIVSTMSLYIFPIFINAVYQVKLSGNKANTMPISWQLSACALGKLFGADV